MRKKLFYVTLPGMEVYIGSCFFEEITNRPPRKHIHPVYELVCIQKDDGMHFKIHPPLFEHFSEELSAEEISSLLFTFGDDCQDICQKLRVGYDVEIPDTFGGVERIKALKTLIDDNIPGVQEERAAQLRLLFVGLARAMKENYEMPFAWQQTWDEERILRLEEYFNVQVQDPACSKQQLAEELGVCERQLTRILKKTYNSNFTEILRNSRITIAEAMLKQGSKSVEEVAEAVGYMSLEEFQKAWLKKFQKPLQY